MVSAFLVGIVLLLHFWKGIPIGKLTRDPSDIVGVPFYVGFLSQIGIFFWAASAAVCMFSATVLSKRPDNIEIKRFLFVSGLLTLVLGLDDIFLLHESVFTYLGVPEKVVFFTYAGFVLLYLLEFYSVILNTEYILLLIALIFFGVSIALDLFYLPGLNPFLFEDGAKIAGIVSWLFYFFRVGIVTISCHVAQQSAPGDARTSRG